MSIKNSEQKHFFVRVGDGKNFINSKHPIWGLKSNRGVIKTFINKQMNSGDIIWFITSASATKKPYIVIGMAEYVDVFDRLDENLIAVNTYSNEEMGWTLNTNWDIQIYYKKLYCGKTIEKHNLYTPFKCSACILALETFKDKTSINFKDEYNLISKYAEPSKYFED